MKKLTEKIIKVGYVVVVFLFIVCAFLLIAFAVIELLNGVKWGELLSAGGNFNLILESIGLLTIAVAALGLAQTILEEELVREAQVSAPTRVRRFLSRFMIVIIISLSIESLVGVFQFMHEDPSQLPRAAAVGVAAAFLLAAWGLFVRLNISAEELEPEALEKAKSEDDEVE
jgi:hypothetical protein